MPIYEYRCRECGKRFDRFFRSLEEAEKEREVECPQCGSKGARKLFSLLGLGAASGGVSRGCGAKPT